MTSLNKETMKKIRKNRVAPTSQSQPKANDLPGALELYFV